MSTLDEITKEKQRLGAALARVDAQREKLTGQLRELEAKDGLSQDADDGNKCGCSSASRQGPAQYDDETSWRQAQLAEPHRSGPCPGNRQDAAGNRRRMQGGSPEPRRRRDFPAQAGRPYRRAGWKALRHVVDREEQSAAV
jgi:hypothetical protein